MAPRAADLLEESLPFSENRSILQALNIQMARSTASLDFDPSEQRRLPIFHIPMRLLRSVGSGSLSVMADRTTHPFGRMGVVREENLPARVGFEGVGLVFETRPVDGHVAGLAAVDARHGLIKVIFVKLGQHNLTDFGYFVERNRPQLEDVVFHHPL